MRKTILVSTLVLSACATQQPWEAQLPLISQLSRLSANQNKVATEADAEPARTLPGNPAIIPAPLPVGQITFVPKKPIQPVAQGMDLVDGAVVCDSLDLANYMSGQINMARHARQSLPAELRRQAALVNGYDVGQEPRLADYGCVLVPAGTPLIIEPGNYVPVVSGKLPGGQPFKGVTLPTMMSR